MIFCCCIFLESAFICHCFSLSACSSSLYCVLDWPHIFFACSPSRLSFYSWCCPAFGTRASAFPFTANIAHVSFFSVSGTFRWLLPVVGLLQGVYFFMHYAFGVSSYKILQVCGAAFLACLVIFSFSVFMYVRHASCSSSNVCFSGCPWTIARRISSTTNDTCFPGVHVRSSRFNICSRHTFFGSS